MVKKWSDQKLINQGDLDLLVKVLLTQSELRPRNRGKQTRDDDYAEGNLAASPNYSPWGVSKIPRTRISCIPGLVKCANDYFAVIFAVRIRHHTTGETYI